MKLKFISVAILLAVPLNTYAKKWDIFLKSNLKGTSSRSRVSGYNLEKKLNDTYTVGGSFISSKTYTSDLTDFDMERYSVFARYWESETFKQGYVYRVDLSYTKVRYDSRPNIDETGYRNGFGVSFSGGYHWQWDNFNIGLQLNTAFYTYDYSFKVNDSSKEKEINIPGHYSLWPSFSFGWAF